MTKKPTAVSWFIARTPHLPHAAHDAVLLGGDEALQHDPDGHVDVVLVDVVTQVHPCMGLRHSDHGLDVSHRDGDAASCLSVRKQLQYG